MKEARQSREALRQQTAQLTGELETAKAKWAEASAAVEGLAERDRELRMLTESIAGIAARCRCKRHCIRRAPIFVMSRCCTRRVASPVATSSTSAPARRAAHTWC